MGQLATQGQQGIQGPVGPIGPRGLIGPQGVKGDTGPTGPKGDIGPQGPVGPKGDIGPQGPVGPKGDIGPQGPVGPAGTFNPDTMRGMTMWCATGEVCDVPSGKSVNVPGSTILQFGADQTKEANAGKIGYKVFSQGLDIVGAGTTQEPRQITMWDTVNVQGVVTAKDFMKGDQSVLVGTDLVNYMSKPDFDKWSSNADKRYATQVQLDTTFQNFVPKIEGATKADLGNYSTKTETDSKIAGVISQADGKYATKAESDAKYATLNQFDATFQSFVPRVEADNKYATKTQIANYYTKTETDTKLSGWASENTATEVSKKTMWCADGQICELPSTTQNVKVGTASVEFGSGLNKEINAGKIVYGAFGQSNKLSIVGGGASNQSRTVKVWDNLEVDKLNTPGLTGPFNFRLYDKMGGQRCMDTNAWSGNGDEVCSDSRSQLFYYSPLTGQIQAVSNNQCLTQSGGQWNWQACNADDPNQQFSKKEHLVQWRNGECLDLGNSNHKAQCDGNNENQKMVWKYKQQ